MEIFSEHGLIMDLSVVIPTKDRPEDLNECVQSLINQQVLPGEIVIVDDGRLDKEYIDRIKCGTGSVNVKFQYIMKDEPGLSVSRNLGTEKAAGEIILFLDDDIILDNNYIAVLKESWKKHGSDEKLGGIGGVIKNIRKMSGIEKIFNRIFMLSSPVSWDVTDVGYKVRSTDTQKEEKVYYLPGGITSFRKNLITAVLFKQLSSGRTTGDDVEFFIKAKKMGYYFLIEPEAKCIHKQSSAGRENIFDRGIKEGYNQYRIFIDNIEHKTLLLWIKFIWSTIGRVMGALINLLTFRIMLNSSYDSKGRFD